LNPDLLSRLLTAAAIVGAGLLAFRVVNQRILARTGSEARPRGLENLRPGIPAILYFTSPDCMPCKTVQRPALAEVGARMGERIQIIEIDSTNLPDLAEYWGVLSVPTTFIIDSSGRPRQVNHGVTRVEKLMGQLESFS
jgi:thioredoxin 1